MTLVLTSFRRTLASLDRARELPRDDLVRDAVVKRFEYCYELSWKFIRRSLIESLGREAVDEVTRRDLFRMAAQHGLVSDPEDWFAYHTARNETSHMYDEDKANEIAALTDRFAIDARRLLGELERRNA
ncbi:MAG: HI0074 family nucleotidyltransferase substrate-binding subunit [Candidatus Eisenbacteria bacterium]